MTKIKICGLRRARDADYANALLPDYIGFVLTPGFRRSITAETAEKLKKRLSGRIRAVGVFVNDSAARINALYENGIIDLAQLHGSENPAFCAEIKAPVIKYFNCAAGAPDDTDAYDTAFYLFDSGTGTGRKFNWDHIPKTDRPFFLAGGLSAQNVKTAIQTVKPYAVDVSSCVETNGYKDFDKIKKFMEMARDE